MRLTIVVDCLDPDFLAPFWCEALGYKDVWRGGSYVALAGDGPLILLQKVAEAKQGKNRIHLDLHGDEPEIEAKRLESIGARRLGDEMTEHGARWIVMADPEGNEFCVCRAPGE